jgi:flagellar protein FliS
MAGRLETYRAVWIAGMDRGRLLLAMYEGALGFLRQAEAALEGGDLERFVHALGRAEGVIAELMATIDRRPHPELAGMLERLYEFMLFQLTEANVRRDPAPMRHVARLLARTYEAYRHVILDPSPEVQAILRGAVSSPPAA